MPLDFVGNVFGSAISAGANYRQQQLANEANLQMTRETNAANRELVELQNKAAKEEAELAYKRSSAGNQVNLLRSAGMSRAGAINTLNGGGSYTPAPVNVSQDQAGRVETADLSALANIGQGLAAISERKHQEKMLNKQLAVQKEENKAQRENAKEIAQISAEASKYGADSSSATARERLEFDKIRYDYFKESELKKLRAEIDNLTESKNYTRSQREHFVSIKNVLSETATETLNKLKEDVKDAQFMRNTELRRLALDKIKTEISAKFGSVDRLRESIGYWKKADADLLYKKVGWYAKDSKELINKEDELREYLDNISTLLDALDDLYAK